MRNYADETIIIAVNFSPDSAELAINIPSHAFEMLRIPEGEVAMTELLTGEKARKRLAADTPFEAFTGPWGAAVWKARHRR